MSAAVDTQAGDTSASTRRPGERSTAMTVLRYAAMPAFLAAVTFGLYLWVTGQELDSVEQRALTADRVTGAILEHVELAAYSTVLVLVIAIPLGIVATRPGREALTAAIIGLGNAGQAIPSIGMLGLVFFLFREIAALPSTGIIPVVASLTAYSLLPVLRNTMVGIESVDGAVLEAGRGMGLSTGQVLRQLELPLAVPVILAGVRTALVINIGTAALAFIIGGGGLGTIIISGYQLSRLPVLMTGAVLTAVLALLVDYLAGIVEETLTPEGV